MERRVYDNYWLAPGESGYIESLLISGARRSRLLDLGLTPGTLLTAGVSSPFGDPVTVTVRGCTVGLRRSQAKCIRLTVLR